MAAPEITPFVLGGFQTNCFVIRNPGSEACWIVDCGYEPQEMLDWIDSAGLRPAGILLTHCHSDHIAGVDDAQARFGPLPMWVHEAETGFCSDPMLNLSALLGMPVSVTEPEHTVTDGQELDLDGETWRVLHAPGHSPGCVCFVHDESRQALVGDTLFAGSIGRFDFPTSDADEHRTTIQDRMMTLHDETTIYPGHGPSTTIGHERRTNPYVLHGF